MIFREYGILLQDAATPDALERAATALETALQETPNDAVCIFVLAKVLCKRQMFVKAKPLLEKLASSQDLKSRHNAYPLLKKCYEAERGLLSVAHLIRAVRLQSARWKKVFDLDREGLNEIFDLHIRRDERRVSIFANMSRVMYYKL